MKLSNLLFVLRTCLEFSISNLEFKIRGLNVKLLLFTLNS